MYYGADYYPEHWPEARWEEDVRLMADAGLNVVRMGEFAWTEMERREGVYTFDWLDRAIALLAGYGIVSVLGTPTATPPAWLMRAHPECFLVEESGRRLTFGHRRNYCPTNAVYREYSARIVQALAKHYADNDNVIGWQIDNEFGDRCYCSACQRAFHSWLRSRYGDVESLNEAWGTVFWSHTYTAWDEIPLPWSSSYSHNPSLALDYRRFMSDTYADYQSVQVGILRRCCPDTFVTHNLMGFGYPKLDYFRLGQDLDFVSWDNYPRYRGEPDLAVRALAHDTMRGIKARPFWVMEEQAGPTGNVEIHSAPRPGEISYWSWQAIAHGADGIVYFRWRTCRSGSEEYWHGLLDHDGVPRRRYAEAKKMGQRLEALGPVLDGSRVQAPVAMVLSYDSRFALQNQPQNPGFSYEDLFTRFYRALWTRNIGIDVVPPDADLSPYALVSAPALYILPSETAQRLSAYVRSGGLLVTTCRTGVMDVHNVVVDQALPGLLAEVCGVEVDEYDSRPPQDACTVAATSLLGGGTYSARTWADVLAPKGAEVLANYSADWFAGRAAITAHDHGEGMAIYIGVIPSDHLMDRVVGWACKQRDIVSPLGVSRGVEVTVREKDGSRYVFLLNGTGSRQTTDIGDGGVDLSSGEDVSGSVTLEPLETMVLRQA